MKYIFIDGGARIGESVEILLDPRPELIGCDAYMFECNPNHINSLVDLKKTNTRYNFIVRDEALWTEKTTKEFFISIDRWGDLGCTLKPEKRERLDTSNPLLVQCISLSTFIQQFNDDDYIILKLDIEGAEYDVLEDLINTGMITKINELYVEFHDMFFNVSSQPLKQKLMKYNIKCDFNWM